MYKNAVWSLVIECLLSLPSSKRLRLEVLYVLRKLEYKLSEKDYLQINAFLVPVVVVWEEWPRALQRKATGGATVVVRERLARQSTAWLSGRQHQLLPGLPGGRVTSQQMSCGNDARVEGLDVTLDDPAGLRGWVLMDGRM